MSQPARRSLWLAGAAAYWADRRSAVATVVFGALLLGALVAPGWLPYGPDAADASHLAVAPDPSASHLLGTDASGRDVLARTLAGGRTTLLVAIGAGTLALLLGLATGAAAGYPGNRRGRWLLAAGIVIAAFVLAGVLLAWLGRGRLRLFAGAGALGWIYTAATLQRQAARVRQSAFLDASRLASVPPWQMVRRHVLPNLAGPSALCGLLTAVVALVVEPVLGLAGLGWPAPAVSWGTQLAENLRLEAPWALAAPAVLLFAALACVEWMRRGLREALELRR